MSRLLKAGSVVPPQFMMDDRGIHEMSGSETLCGTDIVDFDEEYGPLQEVGIERVTCKKCLREMAKEEA